MSGNFNHQQTYIDRFTKSDGVPIIDDVGTPVLVAELPLVMKEVPGFQPPVYRVVYTLSSTEACKTLLNSC